VDDKLRIIMILAAIIVKLERANPPAEEDYHISQGSATSGRPRRSCVEGISKRGINSGEDKFS
jgi:hypothetical protein